MAQAELKYSYREKLRRLARNIVTQQENEMAEMRARVGEPVLPGNLSVPAFANGATVAHYSRSCSPRTSLFRSALASSLSITSVEISPFAFPEASNFACVAWPMVPEPDSALWLVVIAATSPGLFFRAKSAGPPSPVVAEPFCAVRAPASADCALLRTIVSRGAHPDASRRAAASDRGGGSLVIKGGREGGAPGGSPAAGWSASYLIGPFGASGAVNS
jgi:hypothetical protein